jgi:nucleotide-binding universal stress UspA family protein
VFETVIAGVADAANSADPLALAALLAREGAAVERVHIDDGSVSEGLRDAAEARGADLIVLGSSQRGLLGRTFAGNDVTDTLRCTPCAVAVAPRGFAEGDRALARIGAGYDGSAQAKAALDTARSLASEVGAQLHVLGVATPPQGLTTPLGVSAVASLESKRAQIEECIAELAPGIEGVVVDGIAHQELAELSSRVNLLVIGSTRRIGRFSRALLGSTSEALSREAACPLLVVPAPPE